MSDESWGTSPPNPSDLAWGQAPLDPPASTSPPDEEYFRNDLWKWYMINDDQWSMIIDHLSFIIYREPLEQVVAPFWENMTPI